ncbi:hypothetical protein FQV39_05585 [Bosea sp. F3-2]|uniref:hypothetical protein n=1 Tax=Bosea sp. F3-2 TaxID=2599640 RepID=UPI0011EFCF04|nr:hypothetical protein [Bosea sp. F3-2]QEL22093.1 hypothetical protein FQV39_05585 [Bosea sp. F3-2]
MSGATVRDLAIGLRRPLAPDQAGPGQRQLAWSESLTLKAGYRALHVDYRNGGFSYYVTQHAPAVAGTCRF